MSVISGNLFYEICSKVNSKTYLQELMVRQEASFDIVSYKINKLDAEVAKKLYNLSKFKYQISKQLTPNPDVWYQNERKLFIWFIVCYFSLFQTQQLHSAKISIFVLSIDWKLISLIFFGKNVGLLKFQFNNILKHKHRISWTSQQDQLLSKAVNVNGEGSWNEISKHIFYQSELMVFKTPKHCRQRWLNHLDNSKKRGTWTDLQDFKLLTFVKQYGKKWSRIAEFLDHTRTEHMVKNRFNSLMTKIRKNKKQKQIHTINKILRHLDVALKAQPLRQEKHATATGLVESEQYILSKAQQVKRQNEEIEYNKAVVKQQQRSIQLDGMKQQKGSYQVRKLIPTMKTQSQMQVQPVQNVFINLIVANNGFFEPAVFYCYNMLPAAQYVNSKSNHFWSCVQPVGSQAVQSTDQPASFKLQPIHVLKHNGPTN